MKLERPTKIAVCLNAPNLDRALEQKAALISIEDTFDVEWDFRAERGDYPSFSQMINESVIITESEFMIFINPKTEVDPDSIHLIIEKLCSGYAIASTVAFGFWGTTKQLFRKVGLFDERFLGGGAEDDDFMYRIQQLNAACYFEYRKDAYNNAGLQKISVNRIIARSIFEEKWITKDNQRWKSIAYAKEKQLPKNILQNNKTEIESSWLTWNKSDFREADHWAVSKDKDVEIKKDLIEYEWQAINCRITLGTTKEGYLMAEFISNPNAHVIFRLTNQIGFEEHEAVRGNIHAVLTNKNMFWKWKPNLNKFYSIRIAYDGQMLYASDYVKADGSLSIPLTFKYKNHILPKLIDDVSNRSIISITSVPSRFKNELMRVLKSLSNKTLSIPIIVSIPKSYRKGWTYTAEEIADIAKLPGVIVNIIDDDYGPATKLLGGIEWAKKNNKDLDHIITMDDDIIFENPTEKIIDLLELQKKHNEHVITYHGLKLTKPPYYSGNGLDGVKEDWSHSVAGFLGVIYPKSFIDSDVPFNLFKELNPNFYSEDDAYFGAVAARLNIKIWSSTNKSKWSSISKESAVDATLSGDRRDRESQMYNELIDKGFLTPDVK